MPNNCSDQPFIAVSDDKLVIGVNTWSNNCDWSNGLISPKFRGVQFVVADKHDLLAEEESAHIKAMQSVPISAGCFLSSSLQTMFGDLTIMLDQKYNLVIKSRMRKWFLIITACIHMVVIATATFEPDIRQVHS